MLMGDDPWGHGTLCTSVAAGNVYGAANQANIVVGKVISQYRALGTWAALMKALDIMTQTAVKPAVASISLGEGGTNQVLEDAVISTMDKGFTVAVAAGNENSDACQVYPANFKRVITVGASTKTDTRWYSSNHGSCVDIFAPGKDITGAYIGSDYKVETVSGTSEATPIVAGAAAILLSTQKDLTHDQVKAKLLSNATPNVLQTPLPAGSPNLLVYV
ncbi:extracellular serine proteinase-like [Patiria miniata]|uniref:Peptidase S8/S53 domain-containing protein n=1 Tax=Patiria miniata TaxID=46514 RepID=A0A914B6T0_PATMI|nr:extracellular serine proteinase-like [Patiria miniata]